jgi:transcription antitermination protein NusB
MTDSNHDNATNPPDIDIAPSTQGDASHAEGSKPRKRRPRRRNRPMADGTSVTGTSSRHQARVLALQSLYEYDLTGHEGDELHHRLRDDEDIPPSVREYATNIFSGVLGHLEPIDAHIGEAAPAFPVAQLAAIDRNVLRIAIYELMRERRTVPVRVVINEAIEIAKHYGSEKSGRFVHGVLGTVARKLPDSDAES